MEPGPESFRSPCTIGAHLNVMATDMTPLAPLPNPLPWLHSPRYISGFGSGDAFTLFFEDRDLDFQISYARTTSGVGGLPASATLTKTLPAVAWDTRESGDGVSTKIEHASTSWQTITTAISRRIAVTSSNERLRGLTGSCLVSIRGST